MKLNLCDKIAKISDYIEIMLSMILLAGILIMSVQLIKDVVAIIESIYSSSMIIPYEAFMGDALKLIIGIEFVKMLVKHSPESVVEVLLFALARKLIVGSSTSMDIVIGIGSIALLFVVRRFLFSPKDKVISS